MKKWIKIFLLSVFGLVVVFLVGLQVLLHSRVTTNFVNRLASENIDGNIRFTDLHFNVIKSFPNLRVNIDSLTLTYPHERYSRFDIDGRHDARLDAGRGELEDTLAAFSNFKAEFNYWQLLEGHISLGKAELENFVVYAHVYDDSTANWQLFRTATQRDTARAASELPWITLGRIAVKESPRVVYTDQKGAIYADLGFKEFAVGGKYKFSPEIIKIRKAALDIDSLQFDVRLGEDDYKFALDYFEVDESIFHVFDVKMGADALAVNSNFGRMEIPLRIDGRIGFNHTSDYNKFVIPAMEARIAHIPLSLKGNTTLYKDSTILSAKLDIPDCPVDTMLVEYVSHFAGFADKISTDTRLALSVEADGTLSDTMFPAVKAAVKIPGGNVCYKPSGLSASVKLDAAAELTKRSLVNVSVNELSAETNGLKVNAGADVRDLLGNDPHYKLSAVGYATLDSLSHMLPASLGVSRASGNINLDVHAEVSQSELDSYRFDKSRINGRISGSSLSVAIPKDTIDAFVFNPDIELDTDAGGIDFRAAFDSVYFNMGRRVTARLREMKNHATLSQVEVRGTKTPRLTFSSDNSRAFVKLGSNRFRAQTFTVSVAASHRVQRQPGGRDAGTEGGRRARLDSLRRNRPDRAISEFVSRDISFRADSSIANFLRHWSPSGEVSFGRVAFTSPQLPLRTRMQNVEASFDDNNIVIDSLRVQSGTSDLFAKVHVKGLRRMLMRGRGMLDVDAAFKSDRLNINELVASFNRGKKDDRAVSVEDEHDESFVVDSIQNARIDSLPMRLLVVPGNVKGNISIDADRVDFAEVAVNPLSLKAKMADRKLQISGANLNSNFGNAKLNAFYSTQSLKDISAGVDLNLSEISAARIIHMLPAVDDMMPALKTFDGNFNLELSATSRLDENMNLIMPTLDGVLDINGTDLEIKDVGDNMIRWTKLLGFKSYRDIKVSDLTASIVAHDNRLEVFPFELSAEKYKIALYGTMDSHNVLNSHISVLKGPLLIRPGFNLIGTRGNFRFILGKPVYVDGSVPVFTQELDNVQVNIAKSILDIFDIGMNDVRRYNAENLDKLYEMTRMAGFDPSMGAGELTMDERMAFDDMILDSMMEEEEEEDAELDSILENSINDINNTL
ncbi:MAG: AsmA-like C-terminal region-containing protein [Bacteroidales bacterium]|nr:AsmA-like C-terminal region-containing protein [Bacteroidales bacterium]